MGLGLDLGAGIGLSGQAFSYDPSAVTLFAAMTIQPNRALKKAYNDCIVSLKAQSLWTKLDGVYLEDVHDAQAARLNVVNPGTFNLTAFNLPTFTAKQGYTGNGTTAYLDTNCNPSTAPGLHFTRDNACIFAWHRENVSDSALMGVSSAGAETFIKPAAGAGSGVFRVNSGSTSSATLSDESGLFLVNRDSSTTVQVYQNGTSIASGASASAAIPSSDLFLLRERTNFSSGTVVMAGFGSSFSSTDAANLYTILSTFKTAAEAS
jgi:hypothetical protein